MSIDSALTDCLSLADEVAIVKQLWVKKDVPKLETYEPYFQYYATECRRLRLGIAKEAWQSSTMAATTHADILQVVQILSLDKRTNRPGVRLILRQRFPNAEDLAINRSIDFALRIWLMLNVREECYSMHTPRMPVLQWDDTTTLAVFVAQSFPSTADTATHSLQLDHSFTAANINRLSGIDVEWTPCLADHLRFDKRRRLLKIYPFKQILRDHLQIWADSAEMPNLRSRSVLIAN